MIRSRLRRIRDSFRRRALAEAFEDERSFHLEQLQEQYQAEGLPPAEARARAEREFGNPVQAREALREQAGFPAWDRLARDFRHAARALRNRPWISVFVILVLGFGLGSAVAVYSLMDAVFVRALAVSHPAELYAAAPDGAHRQNRLSRGTVTRLEALSPPASVAAFSSGSGCTVQVSERDPERADARMVNGGFFAALQIGPAAGRLLLPLDDQPGAANPVAVASYVWAEKTFGSARAAVGQRISINRLAVTVVGVLPRAFREITLGQNTDLWVATALMPEVHLGLNASESEGDDRPNLSDWNREERISWLQVLMRVPQGQRPSLGALNRAWSAERDDLVKAQDDPQVQAEIRLRAWHWLPAPGGLSGFRDRFKETAWLLGGVVAAMLLLVCANAAGLLLVRSMSRYRELGIRLAIGAAAHQIARLVLIEALLLSLVGALAGWVFAAWLLPVLLRVLAPETGLSVSLDGHSFVGMAAIALFGAVASALIPVLWISRIQPLRALAGNRGMGAAPLRIGRLLVVAQFVIAVVLVTVATEMGSSLRAALEADPGFDQQGVVTAQYDCAAAGFAHASEPALLARLEAAARSVPGVKAVGFSSSGILTSNRTTSGVYFRGSSEGSAHSERQHDSVTPGYFATVGAPLIRGREFTDADRSESVPVAIVSASLARAVYGTANPIGRRFGGDVKPSAKDMTIVGVVSDMRSNGVREKAPEMYYVPLAQSDDGVPQFLAVRFEGPIAAVAKEVRDTVAPAQPGLLFVRWMTLRERMESDVGGDVATARLTFVFGGGALLLAGIGVAAALGYLVILRQRELALRIALGAMPRRLLKGVLADALKLSALGSVIGIGMIVAVSFLPILRAWVTPSAVVAPALCAALVSMAAALAAAWMPARRAARVDPYLLLKTE
ncbi:MAG TPA: ABC transporter permease [Opitutaceae bacterium]|jgi:predicted permease